MHRFTAPRLVLLIGQAAFGFAVACCLTISSLAGTRPALLTAPPEIRVLSGSDQQTVYASSFAAPLVVFVADPSTHQALAGVRINFTAPATIRLSATNALTDERGLASVTATGLTPSTAAAVMAEVAQFPGTTIRFENLVVNKATLTVVPTDHQTSAGTLPAISTYTIQGFVNGDTETTAQITGEPSLTTTATASSRFGNYAIKGNPGTLTSSNYTFAPGFGTLAIIDGPLPDDDPVVLVSSPASHQPEVVRTAIKQLTATLTTDLSLSGSPSAVSTLSAPVVSPLAPPGAAVAISDKLMPTASLAPSTAASQTIRSAAPTTVTYAAVNDAVAATPAPVRSAVIPNYATSPMASSVVAGQDATVHTGILPTTPATTQSTASPVPAAPIRKALTQPIAQ